MSLICSSVQGWQDLLSQNPQKRFEFQVLGILGSKSSKFTLLLIVENATVFRNQDEVHLLGCDELLQNIFCFGQANRF